MTVCGLGYDELVRAIKERRCRESVRLGSSDLNKHAMIFRNGGVTYCYSDSCPHSSLKRVKVSFKEINYDLHLSHDERAHIVGRSWDFLLDAVYVRNNVFSPSSSLSHEGWEDKRSGCAIPWLPMQFFAEDGDVIVFDDYEEDRVDYWRNPPSKHTTIMSARVKALMERRQKDGVLAGVGFGTDRFCEYEKDYELDGWGSPVGVIIKHSKNTPLCVLKERFQKLKYGVMSDYITHDLPREASLELESKLTEDEIADIIKNPANIRGYLEEHRIYLSAYHEKQTKLAVTD